MNNEQKLSRPDAKAESINDIVGKLKKNRSNDLNKQN